MDMPDQFAIWANHRVAADDAVRTNRGAFADHSAIFNPRGGIDRAHRKVSYRWWVGRKSFDFSVVSAG
jgi:hypothetical protein